MPLVTLKRRSEFLRIRGGARWTSGNFVIEGKWRPEVQGPRMPMGRNGPARFGFTVTKKLGSAVVRNRIRRRLRETVRVHAAAKALDGCDYVVVARDRALRCPAEELRTDLLLALDKVNAKLNAARR